MWQKAAGIRSYAGGTTKLYCLQMDSPSPFIGHGTWGLKHERLLHDSVILLSLELLGIRKQWPPIVQDSLLLSVFIYQSSAFHV